jgi:hypothetical protein
MTNCDTASDGEGLNEASFGIFVGVRGSRNFVEREELDVSMEFR